MTPEAVKSAYARTFDIAGETATLRRPGSPNVDATVRIKETGIPLETADDVVGNQSVSSGRRLLILQEDIDAASWPIPIRPRTDQLIFNGRTRTIMIVVDERRRVAGVTVAIEVEVSGA